MEIDLEKDELFICEEDYEGYDGNMNAMEWLKDLAKKQGLQKELEIMRNR